MDAFFVAVELLDRPELRGRPVVVGSPPTRRGVVSTASYEARVFGVRSAMPSQTAGKLCPQAVFLPVRMERYLEMSEKVMEVLRSYTPVLEQVSVDEAFLDIRGVMGKGGRPEEMARRLKEDIKRLLGLTASVGVARNKFLAKLASDLDKPDGLRVVPEEDGEVLAFLAPLPVSRIWGVGSVTERHLGEAGIKTIGDVQSLERGHLAAMVGPVLAEHLLALAHGRDDRPVVTEGEAKSLSNEHTFDRDVVEGAEVRRMLMELAEQVGWRLRRSGKLASTAHVKLRTGDFQTRTRQTALTPPTQSDRACLRAALELFQRFLPDGQPIRLVGFGVSGLLDPDDEPPQLELFDGEARQATNHERKLDEAVDRVRERYGRGKLVRGAMLGGEGKPVKESTTRPGR